MGSSLERSLACLAAPMDRDRQQPCLAKVEHALHGAAHSADTDQLPCDHPLAAATEAYARRRHRLCRTSSTCAHSMHATTWPFSPLSSHHLALAHCGSTKGSRVAICRVRTGPAWNDEAQRSTWSKRADERTGQYWAARAQHGRAALLLWRPAARWCHPPVRTPCDSNLTTLRP